jgi:hypothetical protein
MDDPSGRGGRALDELDRAPVVLEPQTTAGRLGPATAAPAVVEDPAVVAPRGRVPDEAEIRQELV